MWPGSLIFSQIRGGSKERKLCLTSGFVVRLYACGCVPRRQTGAWRGLENVNSVHEFG
nr:MAG TPA: hypothetical protein [Caudoviricetes sp.]